MEQRSQPLANGGEFGSEIIVRKNLVRRHPKDARRSLVGVLAEKDAQIALKIVRPLLVRGDDDDWAMLDVQQLGDEPGSARSGQPGDTDSVLARLERSLQVRPRLRRCCDSRLRAFAGCRGQRGGKLVHAGGCRVASEECQDSLK